jgi:hypothetical protein
LKNSSSRLTGEQAAQFVFGQALVDHAADHGNSLVAMFTTLYLGQAAVRRAARADVRSRSTLSSIAAQMFVFQFLIRGLLLPWVITWPVLYGMWRIW